MSAEDSRSAYISGLRKLADALEATPEVPLPHEGRACAISIYFHDDTPERMAAAARAIPCSWQKQVREYEDSAWMDLHGSLDGLTIELTAPRDTVCTRRVVGTETREVEETVTPAVTRKVTKEVDVVEWDCGSILSGKPGGAA